MSWSRPSAQLTYVWLLEWGCLVALALAVRPLLPVDETRYLSVAWEMWRSGDWLVPHLNGAAYPDKPPLLFWGVLLGWRVFGVNEWWPRLLPATCALLNVLLLLHLVGRLRPERRDTADLVVPFLSSVLWVTYSTLVLFDMLLTTCTLLALIGVAQASRGRPLLGWLTYGVGLGLGALTKGPVVLVHVLPVALLAPWWTDPDIRPPSWGRWYLGLIVAVALGAAIALVWALPAAARGGPSYRAAILWEQTAGRIVHAFAHRRPWWWYLSLLPVAIYPWFLWPPFWRSLRRVRSIGASMPARFALAWVLPGLISLSLISGKQIHYLIPLLPGFAILAGTFWATPSHPTGRLDSALPALPIAVIGILLLAGGGMHSSLRLPAWLAQVSPAWGLILVLGAVALVMTKDERQQVIALSLTSPALLIVAHLAGGRLLRESYELQPVAAMLRNAELAGRQIAHVGRYDGQFHFLGRLERPFEEVTREQAPRWEAEHPEGLVIRYARSDADTPGAVFVRPYGRGLVGIWEADRVAR